ncbi:MAG: hypothetical protein GKR94_10080 [Gammaproteobacteria bacterium]|nr:hypothetical protein [Gammaproteobacteria bacterium]
MSDATLAQQMAAMVVAGRGVECDTRVVAAAEICVTGRVGITLSGNTAGRIRALAIADAGFTIGANRKKPMEVLK